MSDKGADRVAAVLRGRTGAVVIECGACDCDTTLTILRRVGPGHVIRWYAFEPDPRNIAKAEANLAANRRELGSLLDCVILVPMAVAAYEGLAPLRLSARRDGQEWTGSSTVCSPNETFHRDFDWMTLSTPTPVPCTSLDAFAARRQLEHVDLIWADIEGAERQLIEGGRSLLAKTDHAFLEVWDRVLFEGQWTTEETLAALPGWELVERIDNNVLLRKVQPARA